MNKVALTSLGAAGVGGTALGGAMLAKSSPSFTTEKYEHAVLKLDGDEAIWEAKYLILKESKESPTNFTLASAGSKSKESDKEKEAKALLRKGCGEIYNSSEEEKYLKDFKKFCAKTNKDVSTKSNGITGDKKDDSGNTPLSALKNHSGDIDKDLGGIKNALRKSDDQFSETEREGLGDGCKSTKDELFDGVAGSTKLTNQDSFCTKS